MSNSVYIYAFDKEKAKKDFSVFLDYIRTRSKANLASPTKEDVLELRSKIIQDFFKELKDNNLYIPWVKYEDEKGTNEFGQGEKNWLAEDKLNYIFSFGALYPLGVSLSNKGSHRAQNIYNYNDLLEKYNILEESVWSPDDYYRIINSQNGSSQKLDEYFVDLREYFVKYRDDFTQKIKSIYLSIGSESLCVHSSLGDDQCLAEIRAIANYYNAEYFTEYRQENIPNKAALLKIYSNINGDDVNRIAKNFSLENEDDFDDSKSLIIDTLKKLRPLAVRFKECPDSELVVSDESEWPNIMPEGLNKYIDEMVKNIEETIINDQKILESLKS